MIEYFAYIIDDFDFEENEPVYYSEALVSVEFDNLHSVIVTKELHQKLASVVEDEALAVVSYKAAVAVFVLSKLVAFGVDEVLKVALDLVAFDLAELCLFELDMRLEGLV